MIKNFLNSRLIYSKIKYNYDPLKGPHYYSNFQILNIYSKLSNIESEFHIRYDSLESSSYKNFNIIPLTTELRLTVKSAMKLFYE